MSYKIRKTPRIRFAGFTGDWEQRKLEELSTFSKGQGYSKSDLREVGTPIILYGRLYTKYETSISEVDTFVMEKPGSIYSTGTEVIVPASGETAEDIARASAVAKADVLLGGDLNIIYPNDIIDSTFLALSISNGGQQKTLAKKAQGKAVVHLRNTDLQQFILLYPLKEEQNRIGEIFTHLDNFITLHQSKLELLKETKKSLLQKMFPKDGVNVPEIRFAGFTDAWEQRELGEMYDVVSGYAFKMGDYVQSGVPIVNGESIQHGSVSTKNLNFLPEEFSDRYKSFTLNTGDIILGLNRPITNGNLKIAQVPKDLQGALLYQRAGKIIIINNSAINFSYQLLSKEVTNFVLKEAVGSDQPFISTTKLKKWLIFIPPLEEEQTKIGNFFKQLDETITLHLRELNSLKNLKKSLLQQMFI